MKIRLGADLLDMEAVARYCGGVLYDLTCGSGCDFEYICTDSREADGNTLFVATRGERVDGHDYIANAVESGCRCVLCEYIPQAASGKCAAFVTVKSSVAALSDLARGYREERPLMTVAITGSVGKTTTKELTASILRQFLRTYATVGNYNSVIGMPMSLLEADGACDAAVLEMGMSARGEIRSMTLAASPRVAMVTNVGTSHLEYLGTRENIARAKLEIAEGIADGGYLLLNGDEPLLREIRPTGKNEFTTLYVGQNTDVCDAVIGNVRVCDGGTQFDLDFCGKKYTDLKTELVGAHFAYNAAFAASAAFLLVAREEHVRRGLESYRPSGIRQNIIKKNGVTVIADCYNAAPESMRGAIDTLALLDVSGSRIAVLGDMRELGADTQRLHAQVGAYLVKKGIDRLFTVGEYGAAIAEGAIAFGMPPTAVTVERCEDEIDSIVTELAEILHDGDAVLFKASRALKFEKMIEKLF